MKVKKKDILIWNIILFLGFSYLFLYFQYAYQNHLSPFSLTLFKKSLELFWYAIIPIFCAQVVVFFHHKKSINILLLSLALVVYKVSEGLFLDFNKVILLALFCFLVIAYFFYQLYDEYLQLAYLNANYRKEDLFSPLLFEIECELIIGEERFSGFLTNWDSEGCFLYLKSEQLPKVKKLRMEISFRGRKFIQDGEVVAQSTELHGIGLKFGENPKNLEVFNWAEFVELVHELGFKPERLK